MRFSTWVEIDLDALVHNIREVRRRAGDDCHILMVVKADAYGHGAVEVARIAVRSGVGMLGVATLHEGMELRQAGIDAPILILSPPMESESESIIEYELSCTVPSLGIARALSRACVSRGKQGVVHVEVDTGMGRCGVAPEDAGAFISAVRKLPELELEGVFTHFPSSDDDEAFTLDQLEQFEILLRRLESKGIEIPLRHAANSGAVLNIKSSVENPLNMARVGIMIYGLRPSPTAGVDMDLEPVMTFKSRIAQIRDLPAGHGVSYGRSYLTERATKIAVVPVGYGHGYSFRLSNCGEVLIRGQRAPVVGRVTMDVTLIRIDDIRNAAVGDEVILFGRQGDEEITVDEVAERSSTLNYEVICGIGKRVARTYVQSGETIGTRTLIERRAMGRRRWTDGGGSV